MNKMKPGLLILSLLLPVFLHAQYSSKSTIALESSFSTGNSLPFWFTHNQTGKYPISSKTCQLSSISSHHRLDSLFRSSFGLKGGLNATGTYANGFNFHFNELYGGISLWGFNLTGGLFADNEYFGGLSSTNGNIARSLNSRPYPKVRLATDEFIPFFFWKKWFSYKAEYDEGWLGKERHVTGTRLHHKSLYAKAKLKKQLYFAVGLDHYVMWGGLSPELGQLPEDFNSYLLYITGGQGNEAFPETDQYNVAGNQFGTYTIQIEYLTDAYRFTINYNHFFEDKSGMEYDNWRDNLLGIYIDFKGKAIFEKVLYEYMYTANQSGPIHQFGVMRGRDNYFNHGYYKSGYTYKGYMMGSPLFSPLIFSEGIVTGIENNRISMHHLGVEGTLYNHLEWGGLFTYTRNQGTYNRPYETPRDQFSAMINFNYSNPKFPADISLSVASDMGQMYEKRFGMMIKLSKSW